MLFSLDFNHPREFLQKKFTKCPLSYTHKHILGPPAHPPLLPSKTLHCSTHTHTNTHRKRQRKREKSEHYSSLREEFPEGAVLPFQERADILRPKEGRRSACKKVAIGSKDEEKHVLGFKIIAL